MNSEPPYTPLLPSFYRNRFWRFVSSPDEEMSLKLFFDNFRNYTVAAGIIFSGLVLSQYDASLVTRAAGFFLLSAGYLLTGLNTLQLFVLSIRALHIFLSLSFSDLDAGWFKIPVTIFVPLAFSGSMVWFVQVLVEKVFSR